MTFRTVAARFLRQLEANGKSPLTIQVYRSEVERFGRWLGDQPLAKVRPDSLARYLTSDAALLSPAGTPRGVRALNRTKTVLRLFFTYLTEVGVVRHDPARLLKHSPTDRPVPRALTEAETQKLISALDAGADNATGERDRALFALLLLAGMRLGAALALDVADLDLDERTAASCGKNGRVQLILLPQVVVLMLRQHLRLSGIATGHVFRSRHGSRLSSRQAQYRFRALTERAGITRPVTVHALRHTFATNLRRRTGDLRIVQAALGHRHLSTTEIYAHVDQEDLRRAIA